MKKNILALSFVLFLLFGGVAQPAMSDRTCDSLLQIWLDERKPDTTRLLAIEKYILEGKLKSDPDTAYHFAVKHYEFILAGNLQKKKPTSFRMLAVASQAKGLNDEARKYMLLALEEYELVNDAANALQAINFLASLYESKREYEEAISFYRRSLAYHVKSGDQKAEGTSLKDIGKLFYLSEKYSDAMPYLEQSLKIREELGNQLDIVIVLGIIGNVYHNKGELDNAIGYFNRCVIILEELGNKSGISINLNNIGNIYRRKGEYAKALECYEQSLKLKTELGDKKGMAITLNGIGLLHHLQGNFERANMIFRDCLHRYEELMLQDGMARSLHNIALAHGERGDHDSALHYYHRSLAISEANHLKSNASAAMENIGIIYEKKGEYGMALSFLRKGLQLQMETDDGNAMALSRYNIGCIHQLQADSALRSGDRKKADELNKIALDYLMRAMEWQLEKDEIYHLKETMSEIQLAYCDLGLPDSALLYLSKQQQLLERLLHANFISLSENEKQLYFSTLDVDYGMHYEFAVRHGKKYPFYADTVYNIALLTKGLALKSSTAMRQSVMKSGDQNLIDTYEKWLNMKKELAAKYGLGGETGKLEIQADSLEKILNRNSTLFADFDKFSKTNWKNVQSSLRSHEAAVEFVHYTENLDTASSTVYAAILIRPEMNHPEIIRLCTEGELQKIMNIKTGDDQTKANSLYGTTEINSDGMYERIWKPLEKQLEGVKSVYYSPSGLLHKVSFSSLSKNKNTFLCDVHDLNQTGSTGLLATGREVIFDKQDVYLLTGGVNYDSDSSSNFIWNYLPGTERETDMIAKHLHERKYEFQYLSGKEAREESFKSLLQECSVAHVSTHGFFFPDPEQAKAEAEAEKIKTGQIKFRGSTNYADWTFIKNKNPLMRSGLVLAQANDIWFRNPLAEGDDGVLTAMEVSALDLSKTKLVVLSACETGLGDIKGSEGVYGLQRAFKMAGVKHIIMSLWKVPDEETSEFMQLFYKNLLKDKNANTAFRKTQRSMRKKYDPFFWGAFVLIE